MSARGLTISERRSIRFERIALYVVFLVAIIAGVVSFVALTWLGHQMRLTWVAPLVPLMVDGFGVACTVGIARSQASGESVTKRLNEWVGLAYALALSVAGNVAHVLGIAPTWLMVAVAAAPPILLAYGVHIYGRAMARGLSAHIMADDPTQILEHALQVSDERPPLAPAARNARVIPAPVSAPAALPVSVQPAARPQGGDRERVRVRVGELRAQGVQINASALHRELGLAHNVSTTKRWVAAAQAEEVREPFVVVR